MVTKEIINRYLLKENELELKNKDNQSTESEENTDQQSIEETIKITNEDIQTYLKKIKNMDTDSEMYYKNQQNIISTYKDEINMKEKNLSQMNMNEIQEVSNKIVSSNKVSWFFNIFHNCLKICPSDFNVIRRGYKTM